MKNFYINSRGKTAVIDFRNAFRRTFGEFLTLNKGKRKLGKIILLCIGSDKATGDSLGPLIGYKLSKLPKKEYVQIYGTLRNPVHAVNLSNTIKEIYKKNDNPIVIAIDASLGKTEHIGYINIGKGSIYPGAGVKKDLGSVGDIYITGIVNFNGFL